MFFAVITLFPEMFEAITAYGISGRAAKRDLMQIHCINPRDFATGNYKRVDERPFGGGPGMVMMAEPLAKAIQHAKELATQAGAVQVPVVYMSPQGKTLSETAVQDFVKYDGIIVLCGRYEGVDERLIQQYVDQEWSIGDYVLSGGELPAMVVIALFLAFWVALATLTEVQQTVKQRKQGLSGLTKISGSHWGMVLGHLGFAVTLIGISLVSHYEQERDIAIAPGQSADVMDYQVVFERLEHREGPNYDADEGLFTVYQDGEQITQLTSEKRFYRVQRTSMTEVGLDASLLRDIYIAMGEPLDDETWAIRFYIKPFVRWIWLGAIIMAIGGAMALADKRYRKRSKKEAADD